MASDTELSIGCYKNTISWWLENYQIVGEKEGYSPEEIKEYERYLLLFRQ